MRMFRLPRLLVRLCFDIWVHTVPYVIGQEPVMANVVAMADYRKLNILDN